MFKLAIIIMIGFFLSLGVVGKTYNDRIYSGLDTGLTTVSVR